MIHGFIYLTTLKYVTCDLDICKLLPWPCQGYYNTMDAGYRDEDGYIYVMARTDDVINVAGHRLSTGALEEVILLR